MDNINLDFCSLYPTMGSLGNIGAPGEPGIYTSGMTYEDHIGYLISFIRSRFSGLGMDSWVFKTLMNEISLYNQNDENIFIKRVKRGKRDNDPPFYIAFDNLFWDSLPSIGVFPIQFYREEKMLESKLQGKTIDVILEKYNI